MDAWGCCRPALAAPAPERFAASGSPKPGKPRRPKLFQLAHVNRACHAAQSSLRDGICSCMPRLFAPACSHACEEPGEQANPNPWRSAQRATLALLASICLHLGGSTAAHAVNVPTAAEDKLLEVVRLLENKLDTAARFAGEALSTLPGAPAPAAEQGAPSGSERWRGLVQDVWEVVDSNFMDARGAGFSHDRWRQLLEETLAKPISTRAAAYGAIRDMVGRGLRDPYSRFISPEEFTAMLKYDVSGVGLNLGTAEEFVNKTGIPLPGYDLPGAGAAGSSQAGAASLASDPTTPISSQEGTDPAPSASLATEDGPGISSGSAAAPSYSSAAAPTAASSSCGDGGGGDGQSSSSSSSHAGAGDAGRGVYVLGLIGGSAADSAGIEQGDELVAVGGRDVGGQTPFQVASLLAGGQEGEEAQQPEDLLGLSKQVVQLRVRKYGSEEVVDVDLQRPVRSIPSPVSARLERQGFLPPPLTLPFTLPGTPADATPAAAGSSSSGATPEVVGYLKLSSFNARAQRDLAAAVRRLEGEGATRLVLDLRDNRGGLVSEGIEVARLFLQDEALVVRTAGKAKASSAPITAPGPALTSAPLLVLVNEHTASASEILAGALQDNCRAVLAGRQTYGKGLIQSVYELEDGSGLVLTVGKYVTPRGTDIDREGIRPQFRGMPSPAAAAEAIRACRLIPSSHPVVPPPA